MLKSAKLVLLSAVLLHCLELGRPQCDDKCKTNYCVICVCLLGPVKVMSYMQFKLNLATEEVHAAVVWQHELHGFLEGFCRFIGLDR